MVPHSPHTPFVRSSHGGVCTECAAAAEGSFAADASFHSMEDTTEEGGGGMPRRELPLHGGAGHSARVQCGGCIDCVLASPFERGAGYQPLCMQLLRLHPRSLLAVSLVALALSVTIPRLT
jgi:hypothetical protein